VIGAVNPTDFKVRYSPTEKHPNSLPKPIITPVEQLSQVESPGSLSYAKHTASTCNYNTLSFSMDSNIYICSRQFKIKRKSVPSLDDVTPASSDSKSESSSTYKKCDTTFYNDFSKYSLSLSESVSSRCLLDSDTFLRSITSPMDSTSKQSLESVRSIDTDRSNRSSFLAQHAKGRGTLSSKNTLVVFYPVQGRVEQTI
jgi:hypothetical protein